MSCNLPVLSLCVKKGETVAIPLRIATYTLIYKAITAITQSAPVTITATAHGLKNGWRAAVINVQGMRKINAEQIPPEGAAYHPVTVVDANTVQFNTVSSADYHAYTSGGYLVYHAPLDLSAYVSARMTVRDEVGGTQIVALSTADDTLEIDATTQTLWVLMDADVSAAITADEGVFDIELVNVLDEVKAVCSSKSKIEFESEVAT